MIWPQIIQFVVTLIISIALAPKPRAPKSADIEDFDFPTAEEGRPIPVVFGDVEITGSNVLWYGGLRIVPIKKRSGFKKATVGYKYFIGFHLGCCHGPVDAVTAVTIDKKLVFSGNITANGSGSINQPDLFGGNDRGGGVIGEFDIAMGGSTQTANAYLTGAIGEPIPGYRGILSFVWKGGYIGNSEQVRPYGVRVTRILSGWQGSVWYAAAATVDGGMNPAHVLYQVLTDTEWGLGVPTNLINDTNFRDAADTFVTEGFGLHLIWTQSSKIEQFLELVLEHIGGALSLRLDTGLYELSLFRGNYDPDDLDEFDQSSVMELRRFEKQGWGQTVNEVTVIYTDPVSREPTSISAQDLANIDSQGDRVPAIVERPGIRNHDVAQAVLARELASRTTPLTKITFTINRRAWAVPFGGLFKFTWPERQCDGRVFRVLKISKGTLQDNAITIEALEDIYQYTLGVGLGSQTLVDPEAAPSTPTLDDDDTPAVISATTTTPPAGSPGPQNGDRYYVPAGATGAWSGHTGQLAEWDDDEAGWVFTSIPAGTIFQVLDTSPAESMQMTDGVATPISTSGTKGRHAVPIMAGSMGPSVTGGCAALASIASAANQPDIVSLNFDAVTQEYAQFSIPMPSSWNRGTITFVPIWSHAATATNFGVAWTLQAVAVSNDDPIAVSFGTAVASVDAGGTTDDIYFGPESSQITVGGSPQSGDMVFFRVSRDTGNAGDTMAIDARLHGVVIYIVTNSDVDT